MNNQVVCQESSTFVLSRSHLNFLNVFVLIDKRQIYANAFQSSLQNIRIVIKIWFIFRNSCIKEFGLFIAEYAFLSFIFESTLQCYCKKSYAQLHRMYIDNQVLWNNEKSSHKPFIFNIICMEGLHFHMSYKE